MNKLFYIFLILFVFNIKNSFSQEPVLNPINNHYYQIINETLDGINATLKCSNLPPHNGLKGYLATFTSEEEWLWVANNLIKISGWMSGSDLVKTGVWAWSNGSPEGGQPMYNLYFDKCYTFCLFGGVEPNLIPNENWVHTSGSGGKSFWNNLNYNRFTIPTIICEYGGLEEPFIPTSPTQGSTVIISNIIGFDYSKVKINFTPIDSSKATIVITPTKINNTHASCTIPSGQGRYTYNVTDGIKSSSIQYWHYELPYISGVMPSFVSGGKVTITGGNFGTDASKVSVTLGGTPNVTCNSITFERNNEAFTCFLVANITDRFLPITITVSNSKFISYKAAVYYPDNLRFYSGFASNSKFLVSKDKYSAELRVDGQNGNIGVFDSQKLFEFIMDTLPKNSAYIFWQNAYFNTSTSKFYYLSGPKKDQECNLYYKFPATIDPSWNSNTRFCLHTTNLSLTGTIADASTFTEFGGYDPTFKIPNKIHYVTPAGGVANLAIDNYGTVFSSIQVLFRNANVSFERDFILGELIVTIPPGFDGEYDISVKVDDLTTPPQTQFIEYYAPVIDAINRVPTTGGDIVIDGLYFSNTLSNSILTFGSITCSNIQLTKAYSQIKCTLPPSSGTKSVSLKVSQKTSELYLYSYQSPTIANANNIPQVGGVITIEGTNFGTVKSDITVLIGSVYTCSDVTILTNHSKLTCVAPIGDPNTYGLVVNVAGLPSNPFSMYYFSSNRVISQDGPNILINGTSLPSGSTISIGTIDISSNCVGSGNLINCSNIPITLISGDLLMNKGTDVYPKLPCILNPYISGISNAMLDTIKSTTITLIGRYFEIKTYSITNTILVLQDGQPLSLIGATFQILNPQSITVTINGGFGGGYKLSVKVDTRLSNQVEYSFFAPEIKTIVQTSVSTISITGQNFSSNTDKSILTFGTYQPKLTFIDSGNVKFELNSTLSRNGDIFITVENQKSNVVNFGITPYLNSNVFPDPNPYGPTLITITGENLYQADSKGNKIELDFYYKLTTVAGTPAVKLLDCNASKIEINTFICNMVSGYGYYEMYAVSNLIKTSNVIQNLKYTSPIVGKSTSIYYKEPGTVIIEAINVNTVQYTSILIGGTQCTNIVLINQTHISCLFKADILYNIDKSYLSISVNSANLTGLNENGFQYSPLFSCPNDCSGHGTCNVKTGICACSTNWNFTDCSNDMTLINCPNNCSNQGECDRKTGLCSCNNGFEGLDCLDKTCPNQCSNQGICNPLTGLCSCNTMFEGLDCSNHTCPNDCSNRGECDKSNGLCSCNNGFEGLNCSNHTCPNDCSNLGECDKSNGLCTCNNGFEGLDCLDKSCPNQCSSQGNCNPQTGECSCNTMFEGSDCSNYTCPNDCSSQGTCDKSNGLCSCNNGFEGLDCLDKSCPNQCSNQGECDLKTGECSCNSMFEGLDCSNHTCPNDCSNQGTCDPTNGKCFCFTGKSGSDCSIDITNEPSVLPPIVDENGNIIFPGKTINTSISITHLREVDINEQSIRTLKLKDIQWVQKSNISTNQYYFNGKFENDSVEFELTIKYFESSDSISFAGQEIKIPSNSIKYFVTISNWNFTSPLNYLQVVYLSKTGIATITDQCNDNNTNNNNSGSTDQKANSTIGTNDFEINTGESLFNAKFANNVIVDDKTFVKSTLKTLDENDPLYDDVIVSTTSPEYNLLTSIKAPHFNNKVVLDPLFSSIFIVQDNKECSTTQKWKLPVIIVLSSVGGLSIAFATAFLAKKRLATKKLRNSISMPKRS